MIDEENYIFSRYIKIKNLKYVCMCVKINQVNNRLFCASEGQSIDYVQFLTLKHLMIEVQHAKIK